MVFLHYDVEVTEQENPPLLGSGTDPRHIYRLTFENGLWQCWDQFPEDEYDDWYPVLDPAEIHRILKIYPQTRTEKIIMTCGTFDILHPAHIELLTKARKKGGPHSSLYTVLVPDAIVQENKGRLPLKNQDMRACVVKHLGCVDKAYIANGSQLESLVTGIKPNLFVFGYDQAQTSWTKQFIRFLEEQGINHETIDTDQKIHTTQLIETFLKNYLKIKTRK